MTKEDIIRMAQEAGLVNWEATAYANELERFAALVASAAQAKEREACAKVCVDLWEDDYSAYACAVAIKERGQP